MECMLGAASCREEQLRRAYEALQDAAGALEASFPEAWEELSWLMDNLAGELAAAERSGGYFDL